jgi:hypothetical protein
MDAVAVELVVVDVGGGEGDLRADQGDGRWGERGGALGVDELGGREEDEEEAGGDDGGHPHLFAALGPLGLAACRGVAVGARAIGARRLYPAASSAGERAW